VTTASKAPAPQPSEQPRRARWARADTAIVGALVAALVVTRLIWLIAAPDSASYWEEAYRWAAAKEIVEAPIQPLFDYQADNYQGGSLVLILMIAGFFAVLGESVLALKAAALVIAGAILVSLYALGRLYFGRTVGVLAGVGYLAGSPLLAYSSLLVMGSHGESALFSIVELILFLGLVDGRLRKPLGWAGFGFVAGLGAWFCYTSGLSVLACGLTWLIVERLPKPAELLAALGGAIVGLVPWLVYNVQQGFVGVLRLFELFGVGDPIDAWERVGPGTKLVHLIFRDGPVGMVVPFADSASRAATVALVLLWSIPVTAALGLSLWRVVAHLRSGPLRREAGPAVDGDGARELVFWVYAAVFVAMFLGSSFVIQPEKGAHAYRLLLPLATSMIVPVAVSAERLLARGDGAKILSVTGMSITLVASIAAVLLLTARPIDSKLGHDVVEHQLRGQLVRGVLLHRKYERALHRAFYEARRVPDPRLRFRVFQGIGWGMQYRYEGTGEIEGPLRQIDALVLGERVAVLSGLRWTAGERIEELETRVAAGQATPRDLAQLERLRRLWAYLEARWQRLPPALRFTDRIVD